jgi:hypothetical protein
MKAEAENTLNLQELLVNEVVFYTREEISLYGFIHRDNNYVETEYVISRNHLQMLLSQNGKTGIEILWRLEQLFVQPHEVPATLNLVELFGTTQELKAAGISLTLGEYETENEGETEDDLMELLFVNAVSTAPGVRHDSLTNNQ